jgi:hypothetical protein
MFGCVNVDDLHLHGIYTHTTIDIHMHKIYTNIILQKIHEE